jgi:hypothetical protein
MIVAINKRMVFNEKPLNIISAKLANKTIKKTSAKTTRLIKFFPPQNILLISYRKQVSIVH